MPFERAAGQASRGRTEFGPMNLCTAQWQRNSSPHQAITEGPSRRPGQQGETVQAAHLLMCCCAASRASGVRVAGLHAAPGRHRPRRPPAAGARRGSGRQRRWPADGGIRQTQTAWFQAALKSCSCPAQAWAVSPFPRHDCTHLPLLVHCSILGQHLCSEAVHPAAAGRSQ